MAIRCAVAVRCAAVVVEAAIRSRSLSIGISAPSRDCEGSPLGSHTPLRLRKHKLASYFRTMYTDTGNIPRHLSASPKISRSHGNYLVVVSICL